jgi:hypothetical protein
MTHVLDTSCMEPTKFGSACEIESIFIEELDAELKYEVKHEEFQCLWGIFYGDVIWYFHSNFVVFCNV